MAAILSSLFAFFTSFPRMATVLVWVLLLTCVDAQNSSADVQTLLSLKSVMEIDSGGIAIGYWSTWNEGDENPCGWWGVTCTPTSTVEQLSLSGWGLTQLPSFKLLSKRPDLRELDLTHNSFVDKIGYRLLGIKIPDDVGSLIGLTSLKLGTNNFTGPIPSTISACRNLRYLSLEFNQLTGEIPDLRSLVNLKTLYLKGNQLNGSFPQWLGQLSSLLVVELTHNNFSGTIPSLSNPDLLEVMLDNNFFTGFQEPIFPGAKRLEHLSVASNQLQGPIPASITKFLDLRELDLSDNQLSGPIPSNFSINMSKPVTLDLSHNQLRGSIPANLLQPTSAGPIHLPQIRFAHNLLTGPIPFDATQQYNYDTLDFSNNILSGNITSICKNGNTYVDSLIFENNNLSGDILEFFVECYDHISNMRLANNSFSGDLTKIDYINASLDLAMRAANLKDGVRDLSNNNLQMRRTEDNPDPLRAMLEFYVLNTSIVEFRMQGNNFSGTRLPADFNLPASSLQVLDLSNNHLSGEISDEAFNSTWFPALQSLYLSNNDISGPIPEAIFMLPNLAVLDLTNNSLSGRLPPILPSFLPNLFPGNGRLCGGPLRACSRGIGVQWWVLLVAIGGAFAIAVGSCLLATWRWRKYRKMHQQDADLIKTLLERESASLMSLRELKKATNNFAESEQIGKGGFGIVYTGRLHDGTPVAIKRSSQEGSESDKDRFLNEVKILSQINHRHLVKLLGCCMENRIALLVFEFVSNGTLQEHLQGKIGAEPLSWNQRLHIAVQTADALNYLHSAATFPIYHRDVKSANILVDDDLNAKVADFGISKLVPLEVTHVSTVAIQGTLGYIDPEYHTSFQLNDRSDVYSFGVFCSSSFPRSLQLTFSGVEIRLVW